MLTKQALALTCPLFVNNLILLGAYAWNAIKTRRIGKGFVSIIFARFSELLLNALDANLCINSVRKVNAYSNRVIRIANNSWMGNVEHVLTDTISIMCGDARTCQHCAGTTIQIMVIARLAIRDTPWMRETASGSLIEWYVRFSRTRRSRPAKSAKRTTKSTIQMGNATWMTMGASNGVSAIGPAWSALTITYWTKGRDFAYDYLMGHRAITRVRILKLKRKVTQTRTAWSSVPIAPAASSVFPECTTAKKITSTSAWPWTPTARPIQRHRDSALNAMKDILWLQTKWDVSCRNQRI